MKIIDLNSWNRKEIYNHFIGLTDPFVAVVVELDVTKAYKTAKTEQTSFFSKYLHATMQAVNQIPNLKIRLIDEQIVAYDTVHVSVTIPRPDHTFGFSFVEFSDDFKLFTQRLNLEKERILSSTNLFPMQQTSLDVIYCSALPWINFSSHKEPFNSSKDSVPKIAFGKYFEHDGRKKMNISLNVNHAFVDGFHMGQFFESLQHYLDL